MRLLSRLEDEQSCGASWSTYFVRIPNQWYPPLSDMQITQMFTDDGPVLGFDQRIIIGMAGTGLGEFDPQRVEQVSHLLVDVF